MADRWDPNRGSIVPRLESRVYGVNSFPLDTILIQAAVILDLRPDTFVEFPGDDRKQSTTAVRERRWPKYYLTWTLI